MQFRVMSNEMLAKPRNSKANAHNRKVSTAFLVCLIALTAEFMPVPCKAQAPQYTVSTVAGINGSGISGGYTGDGGPATSARLNGPFSVAVDSSGNLYIADEFNSLIRFVSASTGIITTVAGAGSAGATTSGYEGDGGAATSAELNGPEGVALDFFGNLYIADSSNCVIREVTNGTINTIAGNNAAGCGFSGDGTPGTNAQLNVPSGLALDAAGNLYIADTKNNAIRELRAADQTMLTVAGRSITRTQLNRPDGLAIDASGNIYIADTGANVIRKLAPNSSTLTTVAGTGGAGFSGDGGPATSAQLNSPKGVAVDSSGNIFIADSLNNRIRVVLPNGNIYTVAGNGGVGYSGDGGPATSAHFFFPSGVTTTLSGNVYVADDQNNLIRLLTPIPQPPSITTVESASQYGGFSSAAPGSWIEIDGANLAPSSLDWINAFNGINAPTSLNGTTVTIGGQLAFLAYVSPNQVNAQVPSNVGTGPQQITVSTAVGTSAPYNITANATQPGLFAPQALNIGGVQYVGATFSDGVTYVLPTGALALPTGAVAGIASRPAHPGDTIYLYGIGFGPVTPDSPAGQIMGQNNSLNANLQVMFGQTAATVSSAGLEQGAVGVYLFQVVVPNVPTSNAVPLRFTLNGVSGAQTLYTAVQD